MVQTCLHMQINRNARDYVDDIVMKSFKGSDLLTSLGETFKNLRGYGIKLNPQKCIFTVPAAKLLGYLVSEQGIKTNTKNINVIINMKKPNMLHDVQKLTHCLVAPSRFISKHDFCAFLFSLFYFLSFLFLQ